MHKYLLTILYFDSVLIAIHTLLRLHIVCYALQKLQDFWKQILCQSARDEEYSLSIDFPHFPTDFGINVYLRIEMHAICIFVSVIFSNIQTDYIRLNVQL